MEMDRKKFIEALMDYFGAEIDLRGSTAEQYKRACGQVFRSLRDLEMVLPNFRGKRRYVHLGHTFGPFGFKIESEEK